RPLVCVPGGLGLSATRVSLPDPLAGGRIQRHHAAAKRTAFVARIGGGDGLVSSPHRNGQSARRKLRTSSDHGKRVIVGTRLPEKPAGGTVERVDIAAKIAE